MSEVFKDGFEMGVTTAPAYNYESAAAWLTITPHKLRRLVELREIPSVKIKRSVRFRREDMERYVVRCIRPAKFEGGLVFTTSTQPLYDYRTAAEWLTIKPHQLCRLVALREITFLKMGREVRFRREDLERYVVFNVRPAVSPAVLRLGGVGAPPGVGSYQ